MASVWLCWAEQQLADMFGYIISQVGLRVPDGQYFPCEAPPAQEGRILA